MKSDQIGLNIGDIIIRRCTWDMKPLKWFMYMGKGVVLTPVENTKPSIPEEVSSTRCNHFGLASNVECDTLIANEPILTLANVGNDIAMLLDEDSIVYRSSVARHSITKYGRCFTSYKWCLEEIIHRLSKQFASPEYNTMYKSFTSIDKFINKEYGVGPQTGNGIDLDENKPIAYSLEANTVLYKLLVDSEMINPVDNFESLAVGVGSPTALKECRIDLSSLADILERDILITNISPYGTSIRDTILDPVTLSYAKHFHIGDIINYKIPGEGKWAKLLFKIQRFFDKTEANHSGMYIGNGIVMEMTGVSGTRKYRLISKIDLSKNASIIRYDNYLNDTTIEETEVRYGDAIMAYIKSQGDVDNYSYDGLLRAAALTTVEYLTEALLGLCLIDIDVELSITKNEKADFCSEMVYEIVRLAGDTITRSSSPTPGDIGRHNDKFKTIKPFGTVLV